jgi:hypothetical protein
MIRARRLAILLDTGRFFLPGCDAIFFGIF